MLSHELGFMTSWKMLTRDKGWIKPVLVLTLVGWVPILGQIAILGYALEWARLTAWGVDSAPKQSGVNYSKILTTGGIAFLVTLSMSVVVSLIYGIFFGSGVAGMALFAPLSNSASSAIGLFSGAGIFWLLSVALSVISTTVVMIATMRSTIYDSFTAGWRLDRIFQMIARDFGGFMHLFAIWLISVAIQTAYAVVVGLLASLFAVGGLAGLIVGGGHMGMNPSHVFIEGLVGMGPALVLLFVLLLILVAFVGGVIGTATKLITINAVGQWFCRFEVGRWGVSSAPLPDGVPANAQPSSSSGEYARERPVAPESAAEATVNVEGSQDRAGQRDTVADAVFDADGASVNAPGVTRNEAASGEAEVRPAKVESVERVMGAIPMPAIEDFAGTASDCATTDGEEAKEGVQEAKPAILLPPVPALENAGDGEGPNEDKASTIEG